ncbi:MAG: hypothetical protein R2932_45270 [Caldilineaceae bacterium]
MRMYLAFSALAEAYLLASNLDATFIEIDHMLAYSSGSGDRFLNAQLLKLKGDSLLASDAPTAQIEYEYRCAIDVACQQKARSLNYATTSLCSLWEKQGKIAEAHQLLSMIYGWFTEGFDTHDLVEARALLDNLATELAGEKMDATNHLFT